MRKNLYVVVTVILFATVAFAQSSGSFAYNAENSNVACVIDQKNGSISGGVPCGNDSTTCIGSASTTIKTNSGSGNVFVVRPSAVVGLLTDVTVKTGSGTSTAYAGVDFTVTAKPLSGQSDPSVQPSIPVTYDARFIQISTNLFDILTSLCTSTGTTSCDGYLTFNESTLSAHSFDWIVSGLQSGNYQLTVDWKPSTGNDAQSSAATCVGPVNLTVQQNKVFSFNGAVNSF